MPKGIAVYFGCPCCSLVYRAMQVQSPIATGGTFNCANCSEPVHSWTGLYEYLHWRAVTHRTNHFPPCDDERYG